MERTLALGACLAACLMATGCDGGDGGESRPSGLTVSMTAAPPPPGQDVVWMDEGGRTGDLLLVDILARDIGQAFDAFEIEISFDRLRLQARSSAEGGALDACTGLPILHSDNIGNGGAAATGKLLVSGVSTEPPGTTNCTVPGTRVLARVTFAAIAEGSSDLDFVPFDNDPMDPRGSRLFGTGEGLPVAAVSFFDSQATVTGSR